MRRLLSKKALIICISILIGAAIIVSYILWIHPPFLNPSINFYDYSTNPSTTPIQVGILKLEDEFVFNFGDQDKQRNIIAITSGQEYKIFYEGNVTDVVGVYGDSVYYLSSSTLYQYQGKTRRIFMRDTFSCAMGGKYLLYIKNGEVYRYDLESKKEKQLFEVKNSDAAIFPRCGLFYINNNTEGILFDNEGNIVRRQNHPAQQTICYMDTEKAITQGKENDYYWLGDNGETQKIFKSPFPLNRIEMTSQYIIAISKSDDEVFVYDYINKQEEILYQTECKQVVADGDDIYLIPREPFDKDKNIHYYWLNTKSMSLEPRTLQKSQ